MTVRVTVMCGDCDHELLVGRDPALEVACPTCGTTGRCKRPSGHVAPYGYIHPARDVLALMSGAYGTHRGEGRCTVTHEAAVDRAMRRVTSVDRRAIAKALMAERTVRGGAC